MARWQSDWPGRRSAWERQTWNARNGQRQTISTPVAKEYDLLCDEAKTLRLHVELRMFAGTLDELCLSWPERPPMVGVHLVDGVSDLARASRVLREYLARGTHE
jgi:hypothetical protein